MSFPRVILRLGFFSFGLSCSNRSSRLGGGCLLSFLEKEVEGLKTMS